LSLQERCRTKEKKGYPRALAYLGEETIHGLNYPVLAGLAIDKMSGGPTDTDV
jgi:hypothetical protein